MDLSVGEAFFKIMHQCFDIEASGIVNRTFDSDHCMHDLFIRARCPRRCKALGGAKP